MTIECFLQLHYHAIFSESSHFPWITWLPPCIYQGIELWGWYWLDSADPAWTEPSQAAAAGTRLSWRWAASGEGAVSGDTGACESWQIAETVFIFSWEIRRTQWKWINSIFLVCGDFSSSYVMRKEHPEAGMWLAWTRDWAPRANGWSEVISGNCTETDLSQRWTKKVDPPNYQRFNHCSNKTAWWGIKGGSKL